MGVGILKRESDTPWSIDMDGITLWIKPVQRMEIEPWNFHIDRLSRTVQRR